MLRRNVGFLILIWLFLTIRKDILFEGVILEKGGFVLKLGVHNFPFAGCHAELSSQRDALDSSIPLNEFATAKAHQIHLFELLTQSGLRS